MDHGAVGSDVPTAPPFPQCREVCGLNASDRCAFVLINPDCRSDGGYLDYLEGIFCHFPARLLPLAITLYVRPCPGGVGCAGERGPWPQQDLMLFPPLWLPPLPPPRLSGCFICFSFWESPQRSCEFGPGLMSSS